MRTKKRQKITAVLLTMIMALSLVPSAFAAGTATVSENSVDFFQISGVIAKTEDMKVGMDNLGPYPVYIVNEDFKVTTLTDFRYFTVNSLVYKENYNDMTFGLFTGYKVENALKETDFDGKFERGIAYGDADVKQDIWYSGTTFGKQQDNKGNLIDAYLVRATVPYGYPVNVNQVGAVIKIDNDYVPKEGEAVGENTADASQAVADTPAPAEPTAPAPAEAKTVTAKYTTSKVLVNGNEVAFEAYNINDYNYFKLRDIAKAVSGTPGQFNIEWKDGCIWFSSRTPYTEVGGELVPGDGTDKIANLNEAWFKTEAYEGEGSMMAYLINDNNYFKLRDLGSFFGFGVDWDAEANCIIINSTDF